jgi:hypothetical protein
MFLHQMYVYERFSGIHKSFVRNRAYGLEDSIEWVLNYVGPSNLIGVPKSHPKGRGSQEKEPLGGCL